MSYCSKINELNWLKKIFFNIICGIIKKNVIFVPSYRQSSYKPLEFPE